MLLRYLLNAIRNPYFPKNTSMTCQTMKILWILTVSGIQHDATLPIPDFLNITRMRDKPSDPQIHCLESIWRTAIVLHEISIELFDGRKVRNLKSTKERIFKVTLSDARLCIACTRPLNRSESWREGRPIRSVAQWLSSRWDVSHRRASSTSTLWI
jgi:hypothetical protein